MSGGVVMRGKMRCSLGDLPVVPAEGDIHWVVAQSGLDVWETDQVCRLIQTLIRDGRGMLTLFLHPLMFFLHPLHCAVRMRGSRNAFCLIEWVSDCDIPTSQKTPSTDGCFSYNLRKGIGLRNGSNSYPVGPLKIPKQSILVWCHIPKPFLREKYS